jgi:hypothetical protein
MKIQHITIMILTVLIVSVLLTSCNFNSENKINNSVIITGHAIGDVFNDSHFICGNRNECFIYDTDCPANTTNLFRVGNEFCDPYGGAHIGNYDQEWFPYRMCCHDVLTCQEPNCNTLFYYETEQHSPGGSHVFDIENEYRHHELGIGNKVIFRTRQNCTEEEYCLLKTSVPLRNSHIWSCNYDPNNINTTSVCFEPEQTAEYCSNADINSPGYDYETSCLDPEEAIGAENSQGNRLYCSHGENGELETGACCYEGEYAVYDSDFDIYSCKSAWDIQCGFNSSTTCNLGDYGPGERPAEYFKRPYLSNRRCTNFSSLQSCCFNVTKYHVQGNFWCEIIQRKT